MICSLKTKCLCLMSLKADSWLLKRPKALQTSSLYKKKIFSSMGHFHWPWTVCLGSLEVHLELYGTPASPNAFWCHTAKTGRWTVLTNLIMIAFKYLFIQTVWYQSIIKNFSSMEWKIFFHLLNLERLQLYFCFRRHQLWKEIDKKFHNTFVEAEPLIETSSDNALAPHSLM